jgi:lipopolysaccharide export LptBFGC system permease protein LptF
VKWDKVMDELKEIKKWIKRKEKKIKKMEEKILMEIGEVLQRIKKLQVLRLEMDEKKRRIIVIKE